MEQSNNFIATVRSALAKKRLTDLTEAEMNVLRLSRLLVDIYASNKDKRLADSNDKG